MKAIFGLMTVILLAITVVPLGTADFDGADTAREFEQTVFTVVNDPTSTIGLTIDTNGDDTEAGDNVVDVYVDSVLILENETVPTDLGTHTFTITLADLGITTIGSDVYHVEITTDLAPAGGFVSALGNVLIEDYISIDVVADLSGVTPLGENPTDIRFVEDFELEDQDGDDEINSGDTVVLDLELEGDRDYEDMVVMVRLTNADTSEVLSDWDETREFDLANEQERDFTFEFELEDVVVEGEEYAIELMANADYDEANSDNNEYAATFTFTPELENDSLLIRDVYVSETNVEAGDSVTLVARVYNNGEDVQEDIVVSAEIAGLVSVNDDFDAVGTLAPAGYEEWRVAMSIPSDTDAGAYTLTITAESEEGAIATYTETITVEGGATTTTRTTDIDVVGEDVLELGADGEATFTFEIENKGEDRQVYDIEVDGVEADLSQSKITLDAGETAEFTVTVEEAGDFTVYANVNGETAAYEDGEALAGSATTVVAKDEVVKVLQWVFAVIIIIAIILVIVWAVTKGRKGEDGKTEVYY